MTNNKTSKASGAQTRRHFTTRRGFVGGAGFGVLGLYGLWAAYGAAPTSLSFLSQGAGSMAGMGHGHGAGGMTPGEFQVLAERFWDAYRLADDSVKPVRDTAAMADSSMSDSVTMPMSGGEHAGDEHGETAHDMRDGDHAGDMKESMAASMNGDEHGGDHAKAMKDAPAQPAGDAPLDVYVMLSRYRYEPEVLRLETGVPYRFRFMPVDTDHGASIAMRMGSRMVRCRRNTLTELALRFTTPGEYLCYCTVYCGEGHDKMMGRIIVS